VARFCWAADEFVSQRPVACSPHSAQGFSPHHLVLVLVPGHRLGRRWNDRATDATPRLTCAAPSDQHVHLVLGEIQLGGDQVRRGKSDRPTC
jgi:hypothetical protein